MDDLKIIDESKGLTTEELRALKEISRYYSTGKIVVGIIVSLGAIAVSAVQIWDFVSGRIHH